MNMVPLKKIGQAVVILVFLAGIAAGGGCDGTEPREQVEDTVEELSGKKHLDRMQKMKKSLDKMQHQQDQRFKQIDAADR